MIVQQKSKKQSGADKLEKQNYIQHKALRHWSNSCMGYINIKKTTRQMLKKYLCTAPETAKKLCIPAINYLTSYNNYKIDLVFPYGSLFGYFLYVSILINLLLYSIRILST